MWQVLAQRDGAAAHALHWRLAAQRDAAVAWLRARVRPVPHLDAKVFAQRFTELGSEKYTVREQATLALAMMGDRAEAPLLKLLETRPSLEVRQRVEKLLDKIDALEVDRETLRLLRSIAILEAIGTEPARQLLRELAQGALGAKATETARAALARCK
jgi:HEAT repeat protein